MEIGSQIEIIKELKPGGQKKVYLINSEYGPSVLKIGSCASKSGLERIIREVDILKSMDSHFFPKNYEFTYDEQGNFKIIEEYIGSTSLGDSRAFFKTEQEIAKLVLSLIDGLKLLWDKHIVHRDLKPDNILIKKDRQPVIIDLGIARDLQGESLTQTILQRGPCTPVYASPEQLNNQKENIDMRTDFFSIGIIMAELLLGKHPFSPELVGSGMSIVENIETNRYCLQDRDIAMSSSYAKIVKKLLEPKPYNRFRTYQAFQSKLLDIIQ